MSRKIITMLIGAVLLALLCVLEQTVVHRVTGDAYGGTQAVLADIRAQRLEEAVEKTRALDQTWDRQAKLLEVLVNHGSTDDVRYALSRLIAALEARDMSTAMVYASELEGAIEHVRERQALTLENIL